MHRPNFLIIGAARSSTSALARYLDAQPSVGITDPKEPHFLGHAPEPATYAGPGDDYLMNDRVMVDADEYRKLFKNFDDSMIVGEGSVTTFAFPEPSIENIKRYCPADVKLIVCLRDPVERMFSSYLYLRSRERETVMDFAQALNEEQSRTDANWHHMWRYRALSQYEQLLSPFIDAFDRDYVHILISERLTGVDSDEFLKVAEFLDLPDVDQSIEFGHINGGGVAGTNMLSRTTSLVVRNEKLLETAKALVPRSLQEKVYDKVFSRPKIDPSLRVDLQREFEPVTKYVESLVGPLPEWRVNA